MPICHNIKNKVRSFWNNADFRILSGNSAAILIAKILGAGLAFLVQIPLTRLLGAENYGIYVYVLSWIMIAGILTRFGMDITFVRYVPTYIKDKKWSALKGIMTFGFGSALIGSIAITLIAYSSIHIFNLQNTSIAIYLPVSAALLFILTASQLVREMLRGLKRVLLSEIMDSIIRPLLLLISFLFLFYVCAIQDAHAILWGTVLAALTVTALLSVHLWRKIPAPAKRAKPDFADRPEWLALALPMIFMSGMGLLLSRTDIIMLGTIAGAAEAGIYAIGSRFAELTTFGLVAVNAILAPQISEMYHSGQKERLQRLLTIAAWFVFIFTFCVTLTLTAFGSFLLSLFGEEFSAAYIPMLILLGGQMVNALAGPIGLILIMTGRQKETAIVLFITILLNMVGNIALIPHYGMNGAALSTGFSIAFVIIVLFIRIVKNMRLNPSILPLKIKK